MYSTETYKPYRGMPRVFKQEGPEQGPSASRRQISPSGTLAVRRCMVGGSDSGEADSIMAADVSIFFFGVPRS